MIQKIAIYGGAFNPPTLGHFHVINEVFNNTDIEKIIIMPDGERDDKDYKINQKYRAELIEIFIGELKEKGFNIELDLYFTKQKKEEYTTTYKVDKYFSEKTKIQAWHIFGSDIIDSIKYWSGNPDKYIENHLQKIIIPRPNCSYNLSGIKNYILIQSKKEINISSTKVKQNLLSNKKISRLTTPKIEKYIRNNKLYII